MVCDNFYCDNSITNETSHNGIPVWKGRVCSDCNLIVIQKRLENIYNRLPRDTMNTK